MCLQVLAAADHAATATLWMLAAACRLLQRLLLLGLRRRRPQLQQLTHQRLAPLLGQQRSSSSSKHSRWRGWCSSSKGRMSRCRSSSR